MFRNCHKLQYNRGEKSVVEILSVLGNPASFSVEERKKILDELAKGIRSQNTPGAVDSAPMEQEPRDLLTLFKKKMPANAGDNPLIIPMSPEEPPDFTTIVKFVASLRHPNAEQPFAERLDAAVKMSLDLYKILFGQNVPFVLDGPDYIFFKEDMQKSLKALKSHTGKLFNASFTFINTILIFLGFILFLVADDANGSFLALVGLLIMSIGMMSQGFLFLSQSPPILGFILNHLRHFFLKTEQTNYHKLFRLIERELIFLPNNPLFINYRTDLSDPSFSNRPVLGPERYVFVMNMIILFLCIFLPVVFLGYIVNTSAAAIYPIARVFSQPLIREGASNASMLMDFSKNALYILQFFAIYGGMFYLTYHSLSKQEELSISAYSNACISSLAASGVTVMTQAGVPPLAQFMGHEVKNRTYQISTYLQSFFNLLR